MKKSLIFFFGLALLVGLSACGGIVEGEDFDETMLYGRWQEGTVFERYDESGMGATWDTSDDIGEGEAQLFKWTLNGNTLIHEHIGTFVTVPKVYTISTLNKSTLIYSDDYGTTYFYTKVN